MSELDRQMELGKMSSDQPKIIAVKRKIVTDLQQYAKSFVPKDKK